MVAGYSALALSSNHHAQYLHQAVQLDEAQLHITVAGCRLVYFLNTICGLLRSIESTSVRNSFGERGWLFEQLKVKK